jgi:hypothetical protein
MIRLVVIFLYNWPCLPNLYMLKFVNEIMIYHQLTVRILLMLVRQPFKQKSSLLFKTAEIYHQPVKIFMQTLIL